MQEMLLVCLTIQKGTEATTRRLATNMMRYLHPRVSAVGPLIAGLIAKTSGDRGLVQRATQATREIDHANDMSFVFSTNVNCPEEVEDQANDGTDRTLVQIIGCSGAATRRS